MTEELFIELTEYKDILYTAKERNYVMFGTLERKQKLSALYAAVFNRKSKMLNGCGTCALRECKELATVYYNEKKVRDQRELEPKVEKQTVTEEVKPKKTVRKSQKSKEE